MFYCIFVHSCTVMSLLRHGPKLPRWTKVTPCYGTWQSKHCRLQYILHLFGVSLRATHRLLTQPCFDRLLALQLRQRRVVGAVLPHQVAYGAAEVGKKKHARVLNVKTMSVQKWCIISIL